MLMEDTQRVPAAQAKVWAALNDPATLKACIPGCEKLEMTSPTEMIATVVVKLGPVKATFAGKVTLSEIDAPNGYRIAGEGNGGVAGFAKGGASVKLTPDGPNATNLHYAVDAQIGGKLAQLGSRMIDASARKLAGEFFEAFAAAVGAEETEAAQAPSVVAPAARPALGWFASLLAAIGRLLGFGASPSPG